VVAISCALRTPEGLRLWSLGDCATPEGELVQRFFDGVEKFLARSGVLERLGVRSARC